MTITLSLIQERLTDFSFTVKLEKEMPLYSFCLLTADTRQFDSSCLYIGKVSDFLQNPYFTKLAADTRLNCLFLEDKPLSVLRALPDHSALSYLSLHKGKTTDSAAVFTVLETALQELFKEQAYIAHCQNLLLAEVNKTGDLQHLLDLGFELLGNPLLLVDISLCFIAHAGGNHVCDEPLWEWTLSKGYVTEEYVDSIMRGEMESEAAVCEEYPEWKFIWETGMLKHPQLVGRVLQNHTPLGYLKLLAYNHPITPAEQEILGTLCDLCALLLSRNPTQFETDQPLIESFFAALLTQKLYDPIAIEERAHQFHLNLYDYLSVIVVELSETTLKSKDRMLHLKRKLQNSLNRNTVVLHNNHLVILYDAKQPEIFTEREFNSFSQLIAAYGCRAGISPVFSSLSAVPEQYINALSVLSVSYQLQTEEIVSFYRQHALEHMLLKYSEHNDISNLIHPALQTLVELDEEKDSDYVKTLSAYLDNFQNLTEASKALHIHHNTLKYRINRILELTGLDLTNPETVFSLNLSRKALDVLKSCPVLMK